MREKLRWAGRLSARGLAVVAALAAAALVSTFTVDLGPALRGQAERAGSRRIERPMRIGRLSVRLLRGRFVVEDLLIEGLKPSDRPFFKAKRIEASIAWSALLRREVLIESVNLTDWEMVVEQYPGGRHSFPRLRQPSTGRSRFVTTTQYVAARRGLFVYEDHGMPWSTVARNLDVTVTKIFDYRGEASFSNGTVTIQNYVPMRADLKTHFKIEGGKILLDRIDLVTDGARSFLTGEVGTARWPDMFYRVQSRVQFPRMREIFFANERVSLHGEGDFTGTFRVYRGGRELKGTFTSEMAGVNRYRFPELKGSLIWLPDRFDVPEATSRFYSGTTRFTYSLAPLGRPTRPLARFDATYEDVDLAQFTGLLEPNGGIRLAGRASGRNLLEWPLGRFVERRGEGQIQVTPPPGTRLQERAQPPEFVSDEERDGPDMGPFDPRPFIDHVSVGGTMTYRFDPDWFEVAPSRLATPRTYVEFRGRTAYGDRSWFPFHVTTADWQESDRLLAGIMSAFGSSTRAVPVGGHGEFDGVMLQSFARPRVEGTFTGERMRAWDVVWGRTRGRVVIQNSYADIADGVASHGRAELHIDGRFSLGYPRRDGGDEINARIRAVRWPVRDLRHAFRLDDYPVQGLFSAELHLYGRYAEPFGFGQMTIDEGVAYGEPFATGAAGLRFEGPGVRLDGVEMRKGTGAIRGAAYVGWDGTYAFNADGRLIPVESVASAAYPAAPLSGVLEFSAGGSGTFDVPRYDVRGSVRDLFVRDEGIGQITGRLSVRGDVLTLEVEAASPRLAVSGSGRIALTPEADAELAFRFTDTSLDPYARALEPRLSPFTKAVASGSLRVFGELRNVEHLSARAVVDRLDLRLFDYPLRNDGSIEMSLDRGTVRAGRLRLVGQDTRLDVQGSISVPDEQIAVRATGAANLAVLQGFFRDLRSAGRAELVAQIDGPLHAPQLLGYATIADGRVRHFSLPHSLDAVNGRVSFDSVGIRLDDVVARLGGGEVRFGGRIGLRGYVPGELNVSATGEQMQLRYPEGVRSVVDADLSLRGEFESPTLAGTVRVRSAVWSKRFDPAGDLLNLGGGGNGAVVGQAPSGEPTIPLRFEIRLLAPSALRIENNAARIVSSADLTLRGTYDRPLVFGRAEIERGEVLFEGNRYLVTRGTIDFANPTRIEPFFDIEAETRVRVPGQTYRVVFQASGTASRFVPVLSSDPPLPTVDVLSLLFGDVRATQDAELRALRAPNVTEQELLTVRAARLLASPISSEVGRVVEQTFGVDTFQITPSLVNPSQQSTRLNPTARLTIGKRISNRVYLTFSRSLNASNRDQIILLEYDQNERLAWILSQNEDRTYALDIRVRHTF